MKTLKIISSILLSGLVLMSCEKFLDIPKNSNQRFLKTAEDCQLLLDDYSSMNTAYPSDGEASADDYYVNAASYNSLFDLQAQDIYRWLPTAQRMEASPQWQSAYGKVFKANLVLETLEDIERNTPAETFCRLKGAALFFRAYAFWSLAQIYTKPYATETAAQDPGIPVRLSSDINVTYGRGSVKEVYDRIIQDLTEAISLLPPTSTISTRPNKASAYALLARTYLSMSDYPKALVNADEALKINSQLLEYRTLSRTSTVPFEDFQYTNKEILFYSVMAPQELLFPGFATYNTAKIDTNLVKSYTTNDLRRQIFFKANSGDNAGSYRFTGNYEPVSSANLFTGMATDEMFLIRAEGYARAGNAAAAVNDLNTLLRSRWAANTYVDISTTLTAPETLQIVINERRKELVMRGLRWTDLRRLNKETQFSKNLSRTVDQLPGVYTLPANDLRYILLIPREVITNSGLAQNPR